ncbi:hypothetical protein H8K35_17660 [Undibacterium sp. LX40W]|uniref:Transposase n=1 Tax=Undibacterium nitidum TaxID=2762298 RepID=A0A923HRF1_9BURK|nr:MULTISPECIES: hypothetical protein [Undibacterium]MBC3883228.1 hypothetical protein [Undibacterium nitidum]MBC3893510.1 hypothetical protein [Undibacterium sp. LX40W]
MTTDRMPAHLQKLHFLLRQLKMVLFDLMAHAKTIKSTELPTQSKSLTWLAVMEALTLAMRANWCLAT